jgi:serine/threonine protein phosphatase 1
MREGVLDYLADMALFEEITVKEQDYVIVHAGIRNFSENAMLDDLAPEDFIYESLDPDREYYEDKTIIAGHIHTNELPDPDPDMIYYGNGTIFLDCGSDKNGTLGCLCLDSGKEYYVR